MSEGKPLKAMPAGSKVFLPNQAERKRRIESRLLEVFARWGAICILRTVVVSFTIFEDTLCVFADGVLGVDAA